MKVRTLRLPTYFIIFCAVSASSALANTCYAPPRPFAPTDPALAQEFRDLVVEDFETYLRDITSYFRCLDEERARAFTESGEVAKEYGQFIQATDE